MHFKDIKIVDRFNISNKGKAMVTNLSYDENTHKFNKGDTFRDEDKIYEILSSEAILSLRNSAHTNSICFIAKEISAKQLFLKITESKHDASTMKSIQWRIKNRWWLRLWQKIHLFCLNKFYK